MSSPKLNQRKNRRKKRRVEDIYGFSYMLTGGEPPGISIKEITVAELATIGEITLLWAFLEHAMLLDTARLSNIAKLKEMPEDADNLSFKRRLAAWRQVISETIKQRARREDRLKLASKIANLESDRHKIMHGLWQWWPGNPQKLCVWSYRPRVSFRDENFSHKRLSKLSDRIAAAAFELTQLSYPKRKEKKQNWMARTMATNAMRGPYMSRQFLLIAQGKAPLVLCRPEDMRPGSMLPQSSSPQSQETPQEVIDRLVEDGDKKP